MSVENRGNFWGVWGRRDGLVVIVGASGAILQSRDGGISWTTRHSTTRDNLYAIDGWRDHVIAVGQRGTIVRSIDGGNTWTLVHRDEQDLRAVAVWRDGTVLAAGGLGEVLISTDQGISYRIGGRGDEFGQFTIESAAVDGKGNFHLLNTNGDLFSGVPESWKCQQLDAKQPTSLATRRRVVVVVDESGCATSSPDRGRTWQQRSSGIDTKLNAVWIGPNNRLIAVGEAGVVAVSDDDRWQTIDTDESMRYTAVWGDGTGLVIVVGDEGALLRSIDFGDTWEHPVVVARMERSPHWELVKTPGRLSGIHVSPEGDVFVVGKGGIIGRTFDRGVSWTVGLTDTDRWLYDLWGNSENLYGGGYGCFLHSADNGATWTTKKRVRGRYFSRVTGIDQAKRYAIDKRKFYTASTRWGGWRERSVPCKKRELRGVWAVEKQGVFVVGTQGLILQTKDEGLSWKTHQSGVELDLHGVYGKPDGNIVVVGEQGTILHSLDGGATWANVSGVVKETLWDVHSDDELFFAVGETGVVLRSLDEGNSWQLDSTSTDCDLHRVSGASGDVWVLGQDGTEVVLLRRRFLI